MAYSSITSMSYVSSVNNSGNGVRARFTFEGVNNGKLDANDTWAVSFNNTDGPYTMLLNKSTSEQVEGVTAKILTSSAASGNVSGTLELYPLTAGTTYTFQAFDSAYTPTFYFDFTPSIDDTPKTKNLASGTLTESISASTTTIFVYVGDGSASTIKSVWPDTPFYATLMPSNPTAGVPNSLDSEIVKVTDVGNDQVGNTTLSVVRGQRGTTAKAFSSDAVVTNGIFMDDILSRIYPIGSIYMTATLSTVAQVQEALGGTWVAWGAGRVPVGVDTSDTAFDTAEETGGAKTHRHDFKIGLKRYYGAMVGDTMSGQGAWSYSQNKYSKSLGIENKSTTERNNALATTMTSYSEQNVYSIGDTQTESSLQPYITCYMYKRVA